MDFKVRKPDDTIPAVLTKCINANVSEDELERVLNLLEYIYGKYIVESCIWSHRRELMAYMNICFYAVVFHRYNLDLLKERKR